MKTDIVDRLRDFADLFEAQHAPGNLVLHMRAGADEIERKKAEIASLLNTLADERTEGMRLRAALKRAAKELELLYFFAISNGIAEAGIPPHVEARAALASDVRITAQPAKGEKA